MDTILRPRDYSNKRAFTGRLRYFNTSHQFWLNLQANYDVQYAEDAAGRAIARIQPRAANRVPA